MSISNSGTTTIWTFAKIVRTKQLFLKNELIDPVKIYETIRRAWLGYLSLIEADMKSLMSCPQETCDIVQGDG